MKKVLVKQFNILLTFTFTSIGDPGVVHRLFNRFCETESEDITKEFYRTLQITKSFFKIRESYQNALDKPLIGKAKFPITVSYKRRSEENPVREETMPFLIISRFPLGICQENKELQIISLSWLFPFIRDKELDDATDLVIAVTHLLWGASAQCGLPQDNENQNSFELCKYIEEGLIKESIKIDCVERSFAVVLGVQGLSKESPKTTALIDGYSRQIYGMLYSDEGWKEVPNSYALKSLDNITWSTRWFFKFFVSPTSMLLICENENRCNFDELILDREDHRLYVACSQNIKQFPILWHGFFITFEWSNISRQVYRVAKQILASISFNVKQIAANVSKQSIADMENNIRHIIGLAQWAEEKREMLGEGIVGVPEIGNVTRILRERFQILALGEQLKNMSDELESMSDTVHSRLVQRTAFNRERYYKAITVTFAAISLFLAITSAPGSQLIMFLVSVITTRPEVILLLAILISIPLLTTIGYLYNKSKKKKRRSLYDVVQKTLS